MNLAVVKRLDFRHWFRLSETLPPPPAERRSPRQARNPMATAMTTAATAATAFATGAGTGMPAEASASRPQRDPDPALIKSPDGSPAVPGRWRLIARDGTITDYRVTEHGGTLYLCDGCRMSLAVPLRKLDGDWVPLDAVDR